MYAKIDKELEDSFVKTDFPLNIAIEPTNRCNLNCVMCNNDKMTRPRGVMSSKTYKRIIDEVAEENPNTRIWLDFYGEALLTGWKVYYFVDYAKKKGLTNVCINTNGLVMNEEYADMLLDSGVDYISLDCDGFSKEVYESIRINGNRDVFFKNVEYLLAQKKLRKLDVVIDVKVIDMPTNHDEIDLILDYWRQRGAWTAYRRLSDWPNESDGNGKVDNITSDRIACGHAVGITAITWDGNMGGCVWDYDLKMSYGSIYDYSIKEMWQRRNDDFLRLHLEHRFDELPEMCKNCMNWKHVGEMRFDEYGNDINRHYDANGSLFENK